MNCQKCNFQNEETAKFCRNCGVRLGVEQPQPPMPQPPKKSSNSVTWLLLIIAIIVCAILVILLYDKDKNTIIDEEEKTEFIEPIPTEPENSATYDRGVIINGTKWATRNVDERRKFVSQLHHSGNLYTWNTARRCCPVGWRLPTKDEIDDLLRVPNRWTTINGVTGREFGTAPNTIFLPAVGGISIFGSLFGQKTQGIYWSSTLANDRGPWGLSFSNDSADRHYIGEKDSSAEFSVRCVAE